MLGLPVSLRIFRARRCSSVGAYVSGRNRRKISDSPAMMSATQYVHRQLTTEMKPDSTGASCGPQVVA